MDKIVDNIFGEIKPSKKKLSLCLLTEQVGFRKIERWLDKTSSKAKRNFFLSNIFALFN